MSDSLTDPDLCAREPIQHPGAIQGRGALVVVEAATLHVLQRSLNAPALLGLPVSLNQPLGLEPGSIAALQDWLATTLPSHRHQIRLATGTFELTAHRGPQGLLLEFELADPGNTSCAEPSYETLRSFIDRLEPVSDLHEVGHIVAQQIRVMTGFSRTLVYRFDENWNGTVIAEDGDGTLPSYLGLRFPASDIPPQARMLYLWNRLRLIPDVDYQPVPIEPPLSPVDGQALDLGPVSLRSVSPVHLRYMRNMQTAASMSISLVADGQLWGLVTCHHHTPRHLSPRLRSALDFLGQLVAQQISSRERMAEIRHRITLKRAETELLVRLARADSFQAGLESYPERFLAITDATGAALVQGDAVLCAGLTPPAGAIRQLAAWLQASPHRHLLATHCLAEAYKPAADFAAEASGLLAVSISQLHPSYVMWFRRELVHTVTWAGDPRKPAGLDALNPRASFEQWKQLVRGQAQRWTAAEIDAATDFRTAIVDFVLRRAEERADMTEKLQLSNKELEAFSYSVSHDLRAPFRHIVGYAELLRDRERGLGETSQRYLDTIREAALSASRLVDDLLAFSQLSRSALGSARVDMGKLFAEARTSVLQGIGERRISWRIASLPHAWGDGTMIRQAVLNLLSNAVKYTGRREQAEIEVSGHTEGAFSVYSVRDNGTGFDMRYVSKLFGVFQRLHRVEDFEGTGIGLALTKRVIDRHGGWIRAESVLDEGATFTFALPNGKRESEDA